MSSKSKSKKSGKMRGEPSPSATAYSGPVVVRRTPNTDVETINLSLFGQLDRSDTSLQVAGFRFRNNLAGAIPTGTWSTASFECGAHDAYDWSALSTNWSSFRVLGLRVRVISHVQSATNGGTAVNPLGAPPLFSTVIRDNSLPSSYPDIMDSPELQWHPVGGHHNVFEREMKMTGVDEAEWVDMANALTGISPNPTIVVVFPTGNNVTTKTVHTIQATWAVQFRGRV